MYKTSSVAVLAFFVGLALGVVSAYELYTPGSIQVGSAAVLGVAFVLAAVLSRSINVDSPRDRAVVLRLGQFRALATTAVVNDSEGMPR